MPWTPAPASASRTSSSLNGLMIATISFISSPPLQRRQCRAFKRHTGGRAPPQGVLHVASRILLHCVNGVVNNSRHFRYDFLNSFIFQLVSVLLHCDVQLLRTPS